MKVTVWRAAPSATYYRALLHLQAAGRLQIEFLDRRPRAWAAKVWFRCPLVRRFRPNPPRQPEPTWALLLATLAQPLRLLFRRTVVVAFPPYSLAGPWALLLKVLGKDLVYFSSWPHWNGSPYVHRPLPGTVRAWKWFLRNTPAVGVTRASATALARAGALALNIPHAVPTDRFRPGAQRDRRLLILVVGRMVPEKGLHDLVGVFQDLRQQHPGLVLRLVGDGPERSALQDVPGVSCAGWVADEDQLIREYQAASVFVLNSYRTARWEELFGISLAEAMACGLACVATDCVGPRELIQDGHTGLLVGQRDPEALAWAIGRLLENQRLRRSLGLAARAWATRTFSVESNARAWEDVLNATAQTLQRKRKPATRGDGRPRGPAF